LNKNSPSDKGNWWENFATKVEVAWRLKV